LMMLQLALNANPIIFPKIQKKNIIKSSDNMIPHLPFSNKNHCHLLLVDEFIIFLSEQRLHDYIIKNVYVISLFVKTLLNQKKNQLQIHL
jgi:hypothetical protein